MNTPYPNNRHDIRHRPYKKVIDSPAYINNKNLNKPKGDGCILNFLKLLCILVMMTASSVLVSSGDKMNIVFDMTPVKDASAVFDSSASTLLSSGLRDIYNMPKVYVLPKSNEPAPKPNPDSFTKTQDDERKNPDGSDIDYYKDDTIEVKCWREVLPRLSDGVPLRYWFAEVWIQHPSQFRRKLVGDTISNNQIAYPYLTFRKTNGVVGMTSDYCAHRSYGTIIHFGDIKRTTKNGRLDLLIFDEEGNLSYMKDSDFTASELYGESSVLFTFAFGPVLVNNGEICYDAKKFASYPVGELNDNYPRASIGQFGDSKHYLLCTLDWTPNGPNKNYGGTALDIATVMQNKGVSFAYNFDGGQTSTLMFNGKAINNVAYGGQREVSDVIYFASAIPNQ